MPTQESVKERYRYDPETGDFIRISRSSNAVKIGDVAGNLHHTGYIYISFDLK